MRGAVLIGGVLFAARLTETIAGLGITEPRPEALRRALRLNEVQFAVRFGIEARRGNELKRAIAVAAVCAREGCEGRWPIDFATQRDYSEQSSRAY